MSDSFFDTYAYVKKLKTAGVPEEQAEIQAQALVDVFHEKIATKQALKETEATLQRDLKEMDVNLRRDMKDMEGRLTLEIETLRAETKLEFEAIRKEIKDLELRLTVRMGVMFMAGVTIIVTLQKIL